MKDVKRCWMRTYVKVLPDEFEGWLEDMEKKGWHLEPFGQMGAFRLTFRRGEPRCCRYVYDLQAFPGRDYVATYRDFGWEMMGKMASVYIWRRVYGAGEPRPESFSDGESLRRRNLRVFWALVFSAVLCSIGILALLAGLIFGALPESDRTGVISVLALCGLLEAYLLFVVTKLRRNLGGRRF